MFEKVKSILTAGFQVPADQITPDSTLDDLGLDSLATVEFALALEKDFDVEISDDEVADLERLDKITALIERRLQVT
ncbi:acyl carrier protein [Streptomyces tauricus]|uniref:acyl carrier protein n=1 Tax=Streptomyces tauricus TaxID=68274 RepID=UPI002243EF7A|nr:acyl carrier protein [Streptomyces tauricus]MCW8100315.1 acyl carrier protein [Streptomyces tauricus]